MATQKLPRAYSKETMELANQRAPKATKRSVKNRSITEEALSHATSFAEYSALKKKQEAEEGMRSAAEKLNVLTATKTKSLPRAYDSSTISIIREHAPSTITAAQAPADFGVSPEKYVQSIKAINYKHDDETQSFLDKYFGGKVPTEEEYRTTYRNLIDQGKLTEDEMMSFHANQDMLRTATEAEQKRNEAFELLGEEAKNFSKLNESEMYERFAELDNSAAEVAQEYADYAQEERNGFGELKYMLKVGPKARTITAGILRPDLYGTAGNPEMPDSSVLAYANMTPEQRETYLYLAGEYGEKTATDYFDALLRDKEYNKQAYEMREEELREEADEDAVRATLYSMLAAPAQLAGSLYAINQGLTGQEIDPYHSAFAAGQMVQTPRTEVSQNITEKLGKVDEGTGEIKDTFGSVMARGAYNAATSMSDSIMASALGLGIPGASAVLQGGMQFGNSVQDAVLRDGNNGQALRLATVNALIEAGTEWLPADNLIKAVKDGNIKTIKDFGWNMVKSILGEGPGEGLSELGSTLADKAIMQSMSEWEQIASTEGEDAAARNMWKNIGEAMLAGTISGAASGMLGGTASYTRNRNVQLELEAAARQLEEDQKKTVPEAQQPQMPSPETKAVDAREQLLAEYGREDERAEERTQREDKREYMPQPAQNEAQQTETNEAEEESTHEEKPAEGASEGEKEQRLTQARSATVRDEDGVESRVNVVGVMMDDETPVLITENENGETDYALADDLIFDDEMGELLGYEGVKNMDARGLRSYLEGWDGETAPEEYARAYASVYQRAGAGLDYDQAAMQNEAARSSLTEDARMSAYAAGLNTYNQTHDTVPAATIETAEGKVDENAQMSAKETPAVGRLSRRYTQAKFSQLGKEGRNNAVAQMELLAALASRTGHTITVVDSIVGKNGKAANATYNPETREIRVALDATGGAYAYAAMHELTHAVRNEHVGEWDGFKSFVRDGLKSNNQNWEQLVNYQMDRFGYDRATAEEEVICNTVPALLQDERNVLKLYKGNRTLFGRVVDWVKGLLKDVKAAGKQLSTRSQSWAQMDALKNDRELLQGMYDRLMAVMEKNAETSDEETRVVKLSAKDESDSESQTLKEQLRANREAINRLPIAASVQTAGKQGKSDAQLTKEILDEYKASGFEVERQGFGKVSFGEREVDKAVHYANNDAEYAAILAAKKVVKRGIEINERYNHKSRRYDTITFAAPVEVNGKKGIEAVLVKKTKGNRFTVARILTPDGTAFVFENKKDAEPTTGGGRPATEAAAVYTPISPASDNSVAENSENVKFSMQDSVEETRDLLAVHNLTEDNLKNAMELGGLAMPSIAVIKAEQGHSMYGDISVIFDKRTIDPQTSRDNEIYGGDAWTPVFPQVEYEVDEDVENRIREKYMKLRNKLGDMMSRVLYSYGNDLEHMLNSKGSVEQIVDDLSRSTDMMQLYLADNGKETVKPVVKRTVTRMEPQQVALAEKLVEKLGRDTILSYRPLSSQLWMNKYGEQLKTAYAEALTEVTGLDAETVELIVNDAEQANIKQGLRTAFRFLRNGAEKVTEETDYNATERLIREAVDGKAYVKWLNDLFAGAVKTKGIRNNAEIYTPGGKRRSFAQTHWEVTLSNVVKAMRQKEKTGSGTLGRSIEGAAVKQYASIADVKADSGRLGHMDQEAYEAMRKRFNERFGEISREYANGGDQFDAGDALVEYVTKAQTADEIYLLMMKNKAFYKPSRNVAEKLAGLVDEMKNAPTGYFEAKPRRAVGFGEMAALIVPDNLNKELKNKLEESGANLIEYKAGNEDDRLEKMNGPEVNHLMFSLRDTDENVQDALSAQQQAFQQVRSHRITAAEADKLAGEILNTANSDYDRKKLAAEISRIYDYIERGEDISWNQVDDEMTDLMARVMEKSKTLDLEHEEMAEPIRYYLKNTRISLSEGQKSEAANKVGSYGGYRKLLFGRVKLANMGTGLDQIWTELSDMNQELFPRDATEGDQPILLLNAVDALKPVYHTGMGMNVEESASWLAGKLNEAYFNLTAVKAAAKDARTFGDSMRDLNAAIKRFEETSWSEYQNALQSIGEARTAEKRTQKQKETAALRAKYKSWRDRDTAARKEREMKAKYRAKIERTANVLSGWLMKPTDAKHVPANVEESVRRMIASLDFSGKDTRIAGELSARINSMADALLQAQEGEDENRTIFLERDQQMIDELRRVAELIRGNTEHQQMEGRGVYDLNGMELRELSKWLDVVRHVVTETSKLRGSNLPGESVEQVAQLSMVEMNGKKAWKDKKWATKRWLEHFGPDMQDSFTFFERMGPTANAIFKGLRSGFDKVTQLTRQAEKHTKTILEGVNLKELTGKKAMKQTFTLQKGGQLEMNKAQIMELYVLSKREQAQGHIYGEGIRIQGDEDARARQLTKADVAAITGTLTEDEKRVADGLQKFLSRECASWGNETSMKLLGYRKFGEEFYWPIRTDSNTRNTTRLEDNYAANISAIKNQGMTKATIEGAKNAIVVGDIFDTYTRHISNMAAYAGYALPLSDFTRWYNSRGVKTEIEQMMGKKGIEYINNFLMAVNGSSLQASRSGIEKLAGVMTRNAKIASVGANARVVIQQPTSYARAAMYMSPKYLTGALTMKRPDGDLINRYCGIAQWKNWGFYETNIGPNLRQMIVGDETAADKMREAAMKPAALGDQWTLNHLWNACELETRELYPELEQGSDAYYQQVGERMSEVIDRTQVVDSVFHRSQMMRSKSGTAQMLTNFMSEPTKTYNMLMSAISDYADNRKNKAARNRVARALTVYAVTGLMTAAAAAVIDAFRDDNADEEWAEKYLEAVGANAVDNLNPLGLLPGVKDILSLLEGYEPSRLDTQSIQRILWAAQEIEKYANGTSKQNLYGVSYKVMQAVSSTLGIPLSNLMRDGNAIIQTVTGESPTLTAEAQKAGKVTRLYNALASGEKEKAKKLREELRLKAGMTPKEIDTAIAKKLEEDPKIKEAYDAKTERNFADMNRAINALTAKGFGKEAVEKAISSYASNQKPKETKAKDPGEQLTVTFYTEADVVSAMKVLAGIEKGGSVSEADVKAMISERVAGSEAKDPEKSVKSGIQSEMKKAYLEAEAKGNTTAMKKMGMVMKNELGTTQDTMDDWVKSQHADNLRTAVDSSNKTAALKAVTAMRRDGKTDSEIKNSLSKYKQLYIDAVNRKDMATANRIKTMLQSLDLKSKKGASLYTDKHFEDWLKEK